MLGACLAAAEILVGVTGYGDSPERRDLMTDGGLNLWVQWEKSENLLPEKLEPDWIAWAKTNRVHVMTIYGQQDAARTKALRDFWGDLYLGNNLGEYAGFLYQGPASYGKDWPRPTNLREAHDWLVGDLLARPKRAQLARPADAREPTLYSTSGSPLACYELEAGFDLVCNEMYAVGCGNLAYATAEARGAAARFGRSQWTAWLAHEWQTCWPRVPYGVAQKYDSLEVGLKELWVMGTSMMVLESGSQTTQAHDYTPPDGTMRELKGPKQGYTGEAPKAYRRTMRDFYSWTQAHRHPGFARTPVDFRPAVDAALVLGNYDGYCGMTHDIFAIYAQHHLAGTNANWKCAAPEFTWEAVMNTFFPRPADALKPYANGWLGGTPYGQLDVVNVDDRVTVEQLARYRVLAFGGWNTMTPPIARVLQETVARGTDVVLCVPQLSGRIDREYADYTAADLVQAVPGVTVKNPTLAEDILMVRDTAPDFLRAAYPACVSTKLRVAEVACTGTVEVVASMGPLPYLLRVPHGKGAFWLCLAWDYPAARREQEEFPSDRPLRLAFWKTLLTGLVETRSQVCARFRVAGADRAYINWSEYDGVAYLLNTDCVSSRTVTVNGETLTFAPKELKTFDRAARDSVK